MERNNNQKLKIKLNENKAEIRLQRNKINEFRKERTLLDKMYSKLEITIKKKAREYLNLIEQVENNKKRKDKLVKRFEEIREKEETKVLQIESRKVQISGLTLRVQDADKQQFQNGCLDRPGKRNRG